MHLQAKYLFRGTIVLVNHGFLNSLQHQLLQTFPALIDQWLLKKTIRSHMHYKLVESE
jgi:hypothetical protein